MWVRVNGIQLFFDVEGAGLVPDDPRMRERPTMVLLHSGPGFDHSLYKPAFSALTDVAQVVLLDHRGNGRGEAGPQEAWTLAHAIPPIPRGDPGEHRGAAGRHRDRRMALFERFGGPEVGALARRRFVDGATDAATLEAWVRLAFPLYTRTPRNPDAGHRAVRRPEVTRPRRSRTS